MATVDRAESKRRSKRQLADRPQTVARSHFLRNTVLLLFVLSLIIGYFAGNHRDYPAAELDSANGRRAERHDHTGLGIVGLVLTRLGAESGHSRRGGRRGRGRLFAGQRKDSLIGILLDSDDLGRLHIVRPSIHLVAHEKDTNLEQVFAALLTGNGGSNVKAQLDVTEGTLAIDDKVTGHQFNLENLAVNCSLGDAAQGIVAAASGALTGQPQPAGFKVDLRPRRRTRIPPRSPMEKSSARPPRLPLDLLQPILRRTVDRGNCPGRCPRS